jgi:ribonuclease/clavin/mitogillin
VVEKVFITHYHHDHIGGISDIRKLFPSVEIYKNQSGGDIYKELKNIQDGDEFSVEGATLKAVFTPGHTQDHMCFLLKEENAIFTGDNVLGHGTAVFEDLKQYMTSLTKMLELAPYRAYPGHGQIIKDSRVKLNEYIRHRQKREMQLIGHMQRAKDEMGSYGALTSMALVKRIYVDVDEALHLAAERGAIQVLEKLKNENTVGFVIVDGEKRWFLKDNCSL